MHKSKINKISLAVCLAFMPIYGLAAGLGKLNVDSGLGEPLKAQIDLLSVTPDELSSLTATIASEEAYAVQGIPRLGVHSSIRVELAKNADGSPVLRLRSQQPIDEPYLDMLIQVDWASGRLLREYTILLDPPGYKQSVNEETVTPIISKPATSSKSSNATQSNVTTSQQSAAKKTATAAKSTEQRSASNEEEKSYQLTTQRGDTLSSIAKSVAVEGVSLDQVMVGLFEANKRAFTDSNMNRLRVGQIIKVPSKEDLTAIDSRQASNEIKVHASNWNAYKNSLAGNVVATTAAEEPEQNQSASGKIATAEDRAAPVKSGPQDVVKLSAGGKTSAQGAKGSAEADNKVIALQEEVTAREKALQEAQQRTAALEAQIADMQKLLSLKSQTMASMQKNADAAANPAEAQQAATTPPPVSPPADASVVAAAPAVETATPVQTPAPEVAKPAAVVKKVPATINTTMQPEPEQPSFLTSLLESVNLLMLAIAGGVVLLGAGWVYLRNKRRKDLDSFERGILTSGGLRANTVFGNTTGNATSSADTSFLTDFAQSADGAMIDTNDVDPIAEAEVYMAYGRDAQAEEILKDAISKEPKRYELHLKLLEMYAARKDVSAFEAIAGELYTTLGADDPTWAKVAELGITVEPDNPLYDISQIVPVAILASAATSNSDSNNADMDIGNDLNFSLDKPDAITETDSSMDLDSATSNQVDFEQVNFNQDSFEKNASDLGELNNEFSSNKTEDTTLAQSSEVSLTNNLDKNSVADNAMSFDFPDLGSFALSSDEPIGADKTSSTDEQADQQTAVAVDLADLPASEQIEFTTATTADESDALNGLDFNFNTEPVTGEQTSQVPDTTLASSDFNFEGFTDAVTPAEDEKVESSAIEAVDFNFEGFGETSAEVNIDNKPQENSFEDISLDFEAEETSSTLNNDNVHEEKVNEDNKSDEISFDFPLADEQAANASEMQVGELSQAEANNFDFSTINLDLTDGPAQLDDGLQLSEPSQEISDMAVPELVAADIVENENPDIDIKLDLVKVYIDMEDIEGARDLLDEVLKEGGPQQRATAEKLLVSLA